MDRRQVLGSLLALASGTPAALAATNAATSTKWVILEDPADFDEDKVDDDLTVGGIISGKPKKKSRNKKLLIASSAAMGESGGKITVGASSRATFTGTLLKDVDARSHRVEAVSLIKYTQLGPVGRAAADAVTAVFGIIIAMKSPSGDALEQIDVSRKKLTALEAAIQASKDFSEDEKLLVQLDIQEMRQGLTELQITVEGFQSEPNEAQKQAFYLQVVNAEEPLRNACGTILPSP